MHERYRAGTSSLPNEIRGHKLRFGVQRYKRPHIADATAIMVAADLALLLPDKRPNFVDLNAAAGKVPHVRIHDLGATGADFNERTHDRIAVDIEHALGRADRVPLDQTCARVRSGRLFISISLAYGANCSYNVTTVEGFIRICGAFVATSGLDEKRDMTKSHTMRMRVDEAEREGFEKAATLAGLNLSAWARERLRGAARRELTEAGVQVPFFQRNAGDA